MMEHTISRQLEQSAEKYQNKLALSFPAEKVKLDFIDLKKSADLVSGALLGSGLKKGDHIGIWSTNSSRWVLLALGAAQVGIAIVPINAAYKSAELACAVRKMDVNCLFAMDRIAGKCCVDRLECFYENGGLNAAAFPALRDLYAMSDAPPRGMKSWETFLQHAASVTDEQLAAAKAAVTGQDIYSMQSTSGTTAMPKGACLFQRGVLYTADCYARLLHLDESDISCVPLPLFHCFGNVLTLLGGLMSGSSTIYMESFSASGMLKLLNEERCTCMLGVPTMFSAMMVQPDFDASRYHVKKAGVGGSYCPGALAQVITENFDCPGLVIGYGLSEAASLVTLSDIHDPSYNRLGTVGKPLPDFEVSLYDQTTGRISRTLPQGEIICRGPGIMQGYYNDPEETQKALDADGWLHTGDLGAFDGDGYLRVVDRIKDIIVRGGENIAPSQIETVLLHLEGVRDVQCVGVPDPILGEEVAVFVIAKEGLSADDVRAYVAAHMAKYKVPRYVFFTDHFPLSAAGKVLKRELSRIASESIAI